MKVYHFSIIQHFLNVKMEVVQAVIAYYSFIKISWHQHVNLSNHDRK